jgi:tryptophan-rich sensory protein
MGTRHDANRLACVQWAGFAAAYAAAQGLSAGAARRSARPQYEHGLNLPAFAPPGEVFPVVWSALNLTTSTSAWLVWRAGHGRRRRVALGWWALAVLIRSGYVPLEFGGRRLWLATADSALLCAVMAGYCARAREADRAAAALALPEIAWTLFATALSAVVAARND